MSFELLNIRRKKHDTPQKDPFCFVSNRKTFRFFLEPGSKTFPFAMHFVRFGFFLSSIKTPFLVSRGIIPVLMTTKTLLLSLFVPMNSTINSLKN